MRNLLRKLKTGDKRCWYLGTLFLLLQAVSVLFGMQEIYRIIGILLLIAAAVSAVLRKHWWEITAVPSVCMAAFLCRFRPTGYKYVAAAVTALFLVLTVCRFGGKRLRRTVRYLFLAFMIVLAALEAPIVKNARTDKDPRRDYLIILGAAVYGTTPSVSLENRLIPAVEYLNEYPESKAVLSGGKGSGEDITEAECMYRYLTAHGIAPERLLKEERSLSTFENLSFSKSVIESDGGDTGSVAVISNAYHLFRAKTIAASLGMEAAGVAGIPGLKLYMAGMFLREAVGVVHFRLFGD